MENEGYNINIRKDGAYKIVTGKYEAHQKGLGNQSS